MAPRRVVGKKTDSARNQRNNANEHEVESHQASGRPIRTRNSTTRNSTTEKLPVGKNMRPPGIQVRVPGKSPGMRRTGLKNTSNVRNPQPPLTQNQSETTSENESVNNSDVEDAQRRLIHAARPYIHKSRKVSEGIEEILFSDDEKCCPVRALAKMVRKIFDEERTPATRVGEIVHSDVVGPISPATYYIGNRYILFVIDGYSRYLQTFVLKTRDQVPKMVDEAYRFLQAKYPGPGQFDIF